MKRDLDLYRDLLLALEEHADPDGAPVQIDRNEGGMSLLGETGTDWGSLENVEAGVLIRHAELMDQAGLVETNSREAPRDTSGRIILLSIRGITHEGHDYLDEIRDDTVWERTKERLAEVGGQASLETVKVVAKEVVQQIVLS